MTILSGSNNYSSQNTGGQLKVRNKTGAQDQGKASAGKLFLKRPGPTSFHHIAVVQDSFCSAFRLFNNEHMVRDVQKQTSNHGKQDDNFDLILDELKAF